MNQETKPLHVLILDDHSDDVFALVRRLKSSGFAPSWQRAQTEAEYRSRLGLKLDVIFVDPRLAQLSARRALDVLRELNLDIPLILLSGSNEEECGLEDLADEAADVLLKNRLDLAGATVRRALRYRSLAAECRELRRQTEQLELNAPRLKPTYQSEAITAKPNDLGGNETVLIVEGDSQLRRRTGATLVRHGYKVLIAPDAAAALKCWAQELSKIDLLLVSVDLPGGGKGIELANQLRACQLGLKVLLVAKDCTQVPMGMAFVEAETSAENLLKAIRDTFGLI